MEDEGVTAVRWLNPLEEVADPTRAPIPSAVMAAYMSDAAAGQYPKKVHPLIGDMIEAVFPIKLMRSSEIRDPVARGMEADREDLARRSYPYIPPGAWTLIFENAPIGLGELNQKLLQHEKSPLEETHWSGETIRWARTLVGLQTAETSRARTARLEEEKFMRETVTPKVKR